MNARFANCVEDGVQTVVEGTSENAREVLESCQR